MPLTAGDIIKAARLQHPAFHRDRHTDFVCLTHLSERQRVHLKHLADVLNDRLSQARTVADTIAGDLIGVDSGGTPYTVSTGADGYAVAVGADGIPYAIGPVIASDPYTDGFPLPTTALQIVDIYATLTDGVTLVPVVWLEQRIHSKSSTSGIGPLTAIVNGWRLIPQKNPTNSDGMWLDVASVTVVWIEEPAVLTALADALTIPTIYGHTLEWEVAAFLARREHALDPNFPASLEQFFLGEAQQAKEQNVEQARKDHRVVKALTLSRNR